MIKNGTLTKIDYKKLEITDRAFYESFLEDGHIRGCEFSFSNLYLWGEQKYAVIDGQLVILSKYGEYYVYPFPLGKGDKTSAVEAIVADAVSRNIPCRISGIDADGKEFMEKRFPGCFDFKYNEGSFDYVYSIDDLATLSGKKYHGKRNHLYRFRDAYPDFSVEEIHGGNIGKIHEMASNWYSDKLCENPDGDYALERAALDKALEFYKELGLDGIAVCDGENVLAFTIGSRLYGDTFDVHFEKAVSGAVGAYTAVNYEFAGFIKNKYKDIKFIDREEDMGIEGLRKAKKSYYPHHMTEKYRAVLSVNKNEN